MRHRVIALAVVLLAGSTRAAEPCPPENVGVADKAAIDAFVAAVREALASPGTSRIGALIRFPLTVNSKDRRYRQARSLTIRDMEELKRYADGIFSKKLRERILMAPADDLICRTGALGFTDGLVWAVPREGGRLLIDVVNDEELQWPNMTSEELLRCQTSDRLVVIDRPRDRVRYRGWARGSSTEGRPALTLEGADERWDGTGVCQFAIWTFAHGQDLLLVRQQRCAGDDPPYPVGHLSFLKKGTPHADVPEQPCFPVAAGSSDADAQPGSKR